MKSDLDNYIYNRMKKRNNSLVESHKCDVIIVLNEYKGENER